MRQTGKLLALLSIAAFMTGCSKTPTVRVSEYTQQVTMERDIVLMSSVAVLLALLLIVAVLFFKNKKLNGNLEKIIEERTHQLERHSSTLSAVYRSLPDLVFCKDISGKYTGCNPSFEKFAGMKESELIGKTDHEVFKIDAVMVAKFAVDDQAILARHETRMIEEVLTYPDGTQITVETAKVPLMSPTGTCIGLLGISRDITARKKTEETLKLTLDNLDTCIYINEIDTGEIVFINKKMVEEFGGGSFDGQICWKVLQDGFTEQCEFCPMPKLKESGDDYYIWEEHNTVTNKYYRNTDSLIKWQDDQLVHMQHSVDITESVKLQQALESAVQKLETVLEHYPGIIWNVDANRICTFFDGVLVEKMGMDPKTVVGQPLEKVMADTPEYIKHIEDSFREGAKSWTYHHEQEGIILSSTTIPLKDAAGNTIGIVGASHDVTESTQLQHALEMASKAKSDFLSRMSHEIRTPMNAIIGMTNIAKNTGDLAKKDYCLNNIDGASKHLLSIINDILDMTKIEADKFELSSGEFNVEKMLMDVINVVNFQVEAKKQDFIINLDKKVPPTIIQDELRLTQVVTNLLTNAVKFTPEGGTITLNVKPLSRSGSEPVLQMEVVDTGIGISKEQQAKLFTSFEQADGGIARKYGGTGLGLAISKRIVELMGGKIWIESELGKGAKFIFTIQYEKGAAEPEARAVISKEDLRILVVDDSPDTREYFTHIMKEFELPCDVAASGHEALDMLKNCGDKPYNIFFIDWQMPVMNGIELTREIKKFADDSAVVIMISVAEWKDVEKDAVAVGVNRFISKPLFPSVLIDTLNECIGVDPSDKRIAQRIVSQGVHDYRNHTLLIAEDVEINREIMSAILEDTGLSIDFAENGLEAVEKVSGEPDKYSLILMDIHMPEMDGYEATRKIRALDVAVAKTIPIVAMTANVFREDIENCLAVGMNDHIGKPIDPEILFQKLNQYLPPKKAEESETSGSKPDEPQEPLDYAELLPALDVQNGLTRLRGNKKLYFTLLKNFDSKGMTGELVNNINSADFAKTAQTAHAMKGTAANLGLIDLMAVSSDIEAQAKSETKSVKMLAVLKDAVSAAENAIKKLLVSEGI